MINIMLIVLYTNYGRRVRSDIHKLGNRAIAPDWGFGLPENRVGNLGMKH